MELDATPGIACSNGSTKITHGSTKITQFDQYGTTTGASCPRCIQITMNRYSNIGAPGQLLMCTDCMFVFACSCQRVLSGRTHNVRVITQYTILDEPARTMLTPDGWPASTVIPDVLLKMMFEFVSSPRKGMPIFTDFDAFYRVVPDLILTTECTGTDGSGCDACPPYTDMAGVACIVYQ